MYLIQKNGQKIAVLFQLALVTAFSACSQFQKEAAVGLKAESVDEAPATKSETLAQGITAEYFSVNAPALDNAFTPNAQKVLTRVESDILYKHYFAPGDQPAAPGVPISNLAVRFTGYLVPTVTTDAIFCPCTDDGVKFLLDGNNVVSEMAYNSQGARFWGPATPIHLEAGKKYKLRMDYFQGGGGAEYRIWMLLNAPAGMSWEDACYTADPNAANGRSYNCDPTVIATVNPALKPLDPTWLSPAGNEIADATAACTAPVERFKESEAPSVSDPNIQKALRMFSRLGGVSTSVYDKRVKTVAELLAQNKLKEAARIVTEDNGFLNKVVRRFASVMSTRAETSDTPMNDFTATMVGVTRDRLDARSLLVGNFLYRYKEILFWKDNGLYSADATLKSNKHYLQGEGTGVPLKCGLEKMDSENLAVLPQGFEQMLYSPAGARPNPDPAGVLTSRSYGEAHFIAGTNRRVIQKMFEYFTCAPIDSIRTTQGTDQFVGRDLEHFPNGPQSIGDFRNGCATCHNTLDAMRPATAYYHFENGVLKYAPFYITNGINTGNMNETIDTMKLTDARHEANPLTNYGHSGEKLGAWKLNHNTVDPSLGYFVKNTHWTTTFPQTTIGAQFGFTYNQGEGLRELGRMFATSQAFPRCMAKRVFKEVCGADPFAAGFPPALTEYLNSVGEQFAINGYDLRDVFETVIQACME